jgi:membrane-associated phospholipid phosphatase
MNATRGLRSRLAEANRIDHAVYAALAGTPTPLLDRAMRRLSVAANYSRLWIASSILLGVTAGPRGRLAAKAGLASVAVTSAVANLIVKPVGKRRRPERGDEDVSPARQIAMPASRSFPSGHAASAFAFASATGRVLPRAGVPLRFLALLVAYSRVHTGVHYPGDAIAGALGGAVIADLVTARVIRSPTGYCG